MKELFDKYMALVHAVQTGVKICIESNINNNHTPKHLRVGINSALVDQSAVASLLIKKGVFTQEEHMEALVEAWQEEKDRYTEEVSTYFNRPIELH